MESKNSEGIFDTSVHLKAQVDQLTGRNEELRQELKQTQKEAMNFSNQLANANEKVYNLFYTIYFVLKKWLLSFGERCPQKAHRFLSSRSQ